MKLATYFAALARYHAWATHKLLADLAPLSDEEWHRDARLFFGSVHRTVNHLVVTDDIWWARFAEDRSPRIALEEGQPDTCELHRMGGSDPSTDMRLVLTFDDGPDARWTQASGLATTRGSKRPEEMVPIGSDGWS